VAAERPAHAEVAFGSVAIVQALMSVHDPASELSRLNRQGCGGSIRLHPWTARVLERALHWAEASDGAFDPTIGGRLLRRGLLPRHPGQPIPDPRATWRDVWLVGREAGLRRDCLVDLGGIAKGFAVDCAAHAMEAAGAERGIVNAGGDLKFVGRADWTVLIPEPRTRAAAARLRLSAGAVATSALRPGGLASHLPGRRRRIASVTVIAPSAIDADALTKVVLAGSGRVEACLREAGARAVAATVSGEWRELA
jgi:thiamine biosynthesis lipoprotein